MSMRIDLAIKKKFSTTFPPRICIMSDSALAEQLLVTEVIEFRTVF